MTVFLHFLCPSLWYTPFFLLALFSLRNCTIKFACFENFQKSQKWVFLYGKIQAFANCFSFFFAHLLGPSKLDQGPKTRISSDDRQGIKNDHFVSKSSAQVPIKSGDFYNWCAVSNIINKLISRRQLYIQFN